jgi:hypothetical protein
VRASLNEFVCLQSWRNWQTRMLEVHVPVRVWRFKSSRPHQPGSPGPVKLQRVHPDSKALTLTAWSRSLRPQLCSVDVPDNFVSFCDVRF